MLTNHNESQDRMPKQSASAFGTSAIFPADDMWPLSEDVLSKLGVWKRPTDEGNTLECYFCKTCGVRVLHRSVLPDGQGKPYLLDGLVLNAGVMMPPEGSKTEHGHELQMGTNCLGGYLLSRLLEELLVKTTVVADEGTVRVVWLASTLQMDTPKGGLVWDEVKKEPKVVKDQMENYMISKAGNLLLAHETSQRLGSQGIISVAVNSGFLKTELQRHMPGPGLMFKAPKYGAYSELFGLLSPDITADNNGVLIYPWGRIGCIPDDIKVSLKNGQEGGTGLSKAFADWCEREARQYK
ncbi:hypothetical protein FOBRF1_010007 [Fusarium oxysporum]